MLKLIEPNSELLKHLEPKLGNDYEVISLNDYFESCKFTYGGISTPLDNCQIDKYWLSVSTENSYQDELMSLSDIDNQSVWINEPLRAWRIQHLGYQLRLAEVAGFYIPQTVITGNQSVANHYANDKSLSFLSRTNQSKVHNLKIYRKNLEHSHHVRVYTFGNDHKALNMGPLNKLHTSSKNISTFNLDNITLKSVRKFMRLSQLDFGIINLACLPDNRLGWIGFSLCDTTIINDEKQFPKIDLCKSLANFLINK